MGIKQLYNDNLRKLPNEYGDVSIMCNSISFYEICSKVNQVIYSSAPISASNIKALAQNTLGDIC